MDKVNTISDFPNIEEFNKKGEEGGTRIKAIPFRELEKNKVYKIQSHKIVKVGKREALILRLCDAEQVYVQCWATKCIQDQFKDKEGLWFGKNLYIISRGKKESKNLKFYYDFKIICK